MTTHISDQTDASPAARQEAAWARMEDLTRRAAQSGQSQPEPEPQPPRLRRPRRSSLIPAFALLAVLALAAGAFVAVAEHRSTAPTPAAVSPPNAAGAARLRAATSDALAATAAEQAGLAALPGIPTPANVSPVTDALGAALRLYVQVLEATPVPHGARAQADVVARLARATAARIQGVGQLPPILLGAFLHDLTARADRFQHALSAFEQALPPTPGR